MEFDLALVALEEALESGGASTRPAQAYLAGLAEGERRAQEQALRRLAELLGVEGGDWRLVPWERLRARHVAALRARLIDLHYAPATCNRFLAALRGVLRAAWRAGLMTAEDLAAAADVPGVKGSRLLRGRALSGGELRALFEVCSADCSSRGSRDGSLIGAMYGGLLRRAEATALDLADYGPEDGSLRVRQGKGNKERMTYLPPGGQQALDDWISIRGAEPGPLWLPTQRNGRVLHGRRFHTASVAAMLRRRAKEAGIDPCSPHDLRRSGVGDLLDAGADISTAQRLLGHSSVATTTRYDRRPEAAKRHAAQLLIVPWRGRYPRKERGEGSPPPVPSIA